MGLGEICQGLFASVASYLDAHLLEEDGGTMISDESALPTSHLLRVLGVYPGQGFACPTNVFRGFVPPPELGVRRPGAGMLFGKINCFHSHLFSCLG